MSIREAIQKHKNVTYFLAAIPIVLAVLITIAAHSKPLTYSGASQNVYLTADEGKTWFVGSYAKRVPYTDDNGHQVVQVWIFRDGSGKLFPGYLRRISDHSLALLAKIPESQRPPMNMIEDIVIKSPGDSVWVQPGSDAGRAIFDNVGDGDGSTPIWVQP